MKVLHLLETSTPHIVGYTIRARSIIENQRRIGLDPVVVTSPFFPAKEPIAAVETIDGTRYYRTNDIPAPQAGQSGLASYATRLRMIARYRQAVLAIAEREQPNVIHAHSSYANAFAGMPARARLGVPLVYEVRTLWGESAVIEKGLRPDSWKHRLVWKLELSAMQRADLVIPIAQGIREELIRRGIPTTKLDIVPNGVDLSRFQPVSRDEGRAAAIGMANSFVIGFVGSILRLEGLPTLLEAYNICKSRRRDLGLVIVGDGPERPELEQHARRLGLRDVHFTGRVPFDEVSSWYSIMNVLVYPRIRAVINERVTPLKPLEAMALGKVCVGSDVGGIVELIRHDDTGVIFRSEDPSDLAMALLQLADDPTKMTRLQQNAYRLIKNERDWSTIVGKYRDIYSRALSGRPPRH
jgi:PEP-CTERM/exosortase A-associated glycosyltransferase